MRSFVCSGKSRQGGAWNGLDATYSSPGAVHRVAVASHEQRLRPCMVVHAGRFDVEPRRTRLMEAVGLCVVPEASTTRACKLLAKLCLLPDHTMQKHLSPLRSLHPHSWQEEATTHASAATDITKETWIPPCPAMHAKSNSLLALSGNVHAVHVWLKAGGW